MQDRKPPGRAALINPDRSMLESIEKAGAIPKKALNPFKLGHLEALQYVDEKDGMISSSGLGRHWLAHQE